MSKNIKKALEHCINNECADCPNNEELGSGEIVCRARLLPEILEYISDLQHKLKVSEKALEIQNKSLEKCEQWLWEDEELLDNYEDAGGSVCHTFYQPIEHFKEQAEAEINKRSNNDE